MRRVLRWIAVGALAMVGIGAIVYLRDIRGAYARIRDKSTILHSPYGDIEFAQGGSGPPVLVIHGGGGGYDQGELIADALLGSSGNWRLTSSAT